MFPELTAVTLDGGHSLDAKGATASIDSGSFAWTISLEIPARTFALVNPDTHPDGVDLLVTINGYVWAVYVDSYTDNRRFEGTGYTIDCKHRAAELAEPRAPKRTYLEIATRNAAQLANQELPPGWSLDWQTVDWSVPGGTWNYSDLTPLAAVQAIAAAVGAKVDVDRTSTTVAVRPDYLVLPWHWADATPYAILPTSILSAATGSRAAAAMRTASTSTVTAPAPADRW